MCANFRPIAHNRALLLNFPETIHRKFLVLNYGLTLLFDLVTFSKE